MSLTPSREDYIAAIRRRLWMIPSQRRADDLHELQQHVHSLADRYIQDGATPPAAMSEAIRQMGGANKIAREMTLSWMCGELKPFFTRGMVGMAIVVAAALAGVVKCDNYVIDTRHFRIDVCMDIFYAEYAAIAFIAGLCGRRRSMLAVPFATFCLGTVNLLWIRATSCLPAGVVWSPLTWELLMISSIACLGMIPAALGALVRRTREQRRVVLRPTR